MYKVIVFQKKESTPSHENESFLKRIFSCFKVTSTWNISIFMPAHLLRAQTRENLNLPSLKHSWFLWRRRCALHCEGKSVRVQLWKNSQLIFSSNFKIILHRCRSTDPVFTKWTCEEGQTPFTKNKKKEKQQCSTILKLEEKSVGSF